MDLLFSFEEYFDEEMAISWSRQNLYIPFICSIVYLTVVLGVQRYMRDRPPINVQVYAMMWSSTMAVFNIGAAVRMAPAFFDAINQNGWINSLCYFCDNDDNNNNDRAQSPLKFWTFCCIFIKLYEMTNTLFIVLSKRNLSFPHVFHHITLAVYSWYTYSEKFCLCQWLATMNYPFHGFWNIFHTSRAMRIRKPAVPVLILGLLEVSAFLSECFFFTQVRATGVWVPPFQINQPFWATPRTFGLP